MSQPTRKLWCFTVTAALALLAAPSADSEAPGLGFLPPPRPAPPAESRDDWLDWQSDPRGSYREFLHERQEAAREMRERKREDRLEGPSPEPGGESLAERLEAERQESFERLEERTPEQRLRPDTLRRNRPGLRN